MRRAISMAVVYLMISEGVTRYLDDCLLALKVVSIDGLAIWRLGRTEHRRALEQRRVRTVCWCGNLTAMSLPDSTEV